MSGGAQDVTDRVKGYVGMRKVSLGRTEPHGHLRPMLNNEFVFQIGFLDQVTLLHCTKVYREGGGGLSAMGNTTSFSLGASVKVLVYCGQLKHAGDFA